MVLNVKDYSTGLSFLSSLLKRYGKYLFFFIIIPLLMSILVLFTLVNWTVIKDSSIGSALLALLMGVLIIKLYVFYNYLKEQVLQSVYAIFIIRLIKSEKFVNAMLSNIEYDSKQKIPNRKHAVEYNINEFNKLLKPLKVNEFILEYAVLNTLNYFLLLTAILGYFQFILEKIVASQITGTIIIVLIAVFMIPIILLTVCLVYLDTAIIKDFREKIVVTEVVTDKETFIGDLVEENKTHVRIATLEEYEWGELPKNIRTHRVEVDIPQNNIISIINHIIDV